MVGGDERYKIQDTRYKIPARTAEHLPKVVYERSVGGQKKEKRNGKRIQNRKPHLEGDEVSCFNYFSTRDLEYSSRRVSG